MRVIISKGEETKATSSLKYLPRIGEHVLFNKFGGQVKSVIHNYKEEIKDDGKTIHTL